MEVGVIKQEDLAAEETILRKLLSADLNFAGTNGNYGLHNFHAFAAKFPPQLPRFFIEHLTQKGEIILDPMMGSGTTVVEAMLLGRKGIGFDIDPLAVSISRTKTTPVSPNEIERGYLELRDKVRHILADSPRLVKTLDERFDVETKKFVDYWFLPHTQRELMTLVLAIESIAHQRLRNFYELIFSSIIVTKSGGVSKARDLAHSRPHLDRGKIPRSAFEMFELRLHKILQTYPNLDSEVLPARLERCDARSMPLDNNSIHLIVTSPPYANAIDYMRAHKFSLVWFDKKVRELADLRSQYVGTERTGDIGTNGLPHSVVQTVNQISVADLSKAKILTRYFQDMKIIIGEMFRVLRPGKCAIIVVGSSTMRGIDTQTHRNLSDIATNVGFNLIGISKRSLDRNRRMMPARFGDKKSSQIEKRMYEEFVIGLQKPGNHWVIS